MNFNCVVAQVPPVDMVKLDKHLDLVIRSAWAESTLRTRNSQWSKYIDFCKANGLVPVPGEVLTVSRFLVNLASTCVYSTCNNYLSAIISLHKFFGYDPYFRESFLVKLVLKGLSRNLGTSVNQKVGLTPNDFVQIYSKLDLSDINVITKWSALMLSFRSLLRKSNIVQTTLKDPGMVVLRSDLEFSEKGVMLNVRKTKTIQRREYVLRVPVYFAHSDSMCAASMLASHLARTSAFKEGPLFLILTKKGEWRPLLYTDLLGFLKQCVSLIGLNPEEVGLHSMRRSGAAFLHTLGVSLIDIMNAGDWKSLAALSYLISPLERKQDIEKLFSSALSEM